jgi:acyl-CoA thioester hydrolase
LMAPSGSGAGPWRVHRRFYVPYHDIDALNHLNHVAYFPMMETLRCDYYLPLLASTDPATLDIIIAEATCRFLAPVLYGSELLGEIAPARPLGKSSFSFLYRFSDAVTGTVTARGRTVVVCYDYTKGSKKPIPDDRRRVIDQDSVDPASEGWPAPAP